MEEQRAFMASEKSWKVRVQDEIDPKGFIKFRDGSERTVRFVKEPYERPFRARDGTEKISFEFPVEVNGEEKIMSVTSKRLLRKLVAEDNKSALIGRTLNIRAIGGGTSRDWIVKS